MYISIILSPALKSYFPSKIQFYSTNMNLSYIILNIRVYNISITGKYNYMSTILFNIYNNNSYIIIKSFIQSNPQTYSFNYMTYEVLSC